MVDNDMILYKERCIGISEKRIRHIVGVADECFRLALVEYKMSYPQAIKAYMIGYLHDVGYAFSEEPFQHSTVGWNMIKTSLGVDIPEVLLHGEPELDQESFLRILNIADITTDSNGNHCSAEKRLKHIEKEYGKNSPKYQKVLAVAQKLELL